MSINWSPALELHIEIIDRQHHRLVDVINELEDAIRGNRVKDELLSILDEIAEYPKVHFKTEEDFFDQFGCYPDADIHKSAHADFIVHINNLREQFKNDELTLSIELVQFLTGWLTEHMQVMDHGYVKCFKEHGL